MKTKLIVCAFILLVVALGSIPTPAYAATPGHIYGSVASSDDGYAALKAPSTGFAVAYKVSDASDTADLRNTNTTGATYNGYFLYDAGSLWKSWSKGDDVVVVVEIGNTESGGHGSHVASTDMIKTLAFSDTFPSCKLEKIPTPVFDSSGSTHITLTWTALEDTNGNVESYSVYRSTDGTSFLYAGTAQHVSGTVTFSDTGLSGGSFYYKIKVKFRGGYESEGFSEKSAQMSTGGSATPPPSTPTLGTTPTPTQLGTTPTPTQQLGTTPTPTATQTSGSTPTPASTTASVQTTTAAQKKNESADVVGSLVSSISNVSSGLTSGETGGLPNFMLIIIAAALIAAGGFAVRRRRRKIRTYIKRKIEKAPAAEDTVTVQPAATAVRTAPIQVPQPGPVATPTAGTCPNCGAPLPGGAKFCGGCGAKIGKEKPIVKEKDEQRLRVLAERERLKIEEERKRLDKERKRVEKERQKLEKASAAKVRKPKKSKPSEKYEIDKEHLDQIFK